MARKIKTGDVVFVICGDDKGTRGEVLSVDPQKDRLIVRGVNVRVRHVKPSMKFPEGGIIRKECPIHISNVALAVDPSADSVEWKATLVTRVGFRHDKEGKKVRFAKRTQKEISELRVSVRNK